MLFKIAFRNLWRNRTRTAITAGVVALAVLIAIFMRSMQEGTYNQMVDNVVGMYTGYVQVHQKGYWAEQSLDNSLDVTGDWQSQLAADPKVNALVPRLEGFALASHGDMSKAAVVLGIDPVKEAPFSHLPDRVIEGEYVSQEKAGLLIASGLAKRLKVQLGDSLVLLGQGYHGMTAAGIYPITGIMRFGSPQLNDRLIYMNLATAQRLFVMPDRVTAMIVDLQAGDAAVETASRLQSQLDSSLYEVMPWQTMSPELVQMIEGDRAGGIITMLILYAIIAFIIFGTVVMMMAERKYEFGVMHAVGMSRLKLILMMLIELALLTSLGLVVGAFIAGPLVWFFHHNPITLGDELAAAYAEFGMEAVLPTAIDPAIFLTQAYWVLGFVAIISLYPVIKLMRLAPVEAMR